MKKFWSYKNEYIYLRNRILKSIDKTLKSDQLFFGPELRKFEKNFTKTYKFKYGAAVGSGTDALLIALKSLNIGKNDEVITVSNTAIPTASAIKSSGASIKFVDIDNNYLMDPKKIENSISKKTKAIIPVHLYGQACDMDKIIKIAKKYNLKIIEDCAQAQGAKYKNKFVGSFGDLGCFSFYPTKILGGYGDGGFISTKSPNLYKKIMRIRFYGIENFDNKNKFYREYYSNEHGINSRIDELHLSILNLKLPMVKSWIKKRRKIAKIYTNELKTNCLKLPIEKRGNTHVYHLYTVFHKKRDLIIKKLNHKKISSKIYYPHPIHKMKAYKQHNNSRLNRLPNTEKMTKGIFCLPLYPKMNTNDAKKIAKSITTILKKI